MADTAEIRPFRIEIPESELHDLRDRLARTRWPFGVPADGWSRGIPADYLSELADYWSNGFDWGKEQAALNDIPQFVTEIDGQQIHFLHVRSPEPEALPLILTHGYPSSFVEYLDVIGPLSDPRSHGGDPADAFHLVIPTMPGFGYSTPIAEGGWPMARVGKAWAELMHRLGYERYGAQGGDVGAGVTGVLGGVAPDAVVGTHVSSDPRTLAAIVGEYVFVDEGTLSADELEHLESLKAKAAQGKGYLQLQSTRPQSLAYALSDSPAFQLGWIAEPFRAWTEQTPLRPYGVDRDRLLTNVSLYWFTGCGATAAHILYDNAHATDWVPPGPMPAGTAVFDADPIVRKVLDPAGEAAHWSEFDAGGHFPALEVPDLLVADLRAFFRPLR